MMEGLSLPQRLPLLLRLLVPQQWLRILFLGALGLLLSGFFLNGLFGWVLAKFFIFMGACFAILLPMLSLPSQLLSLVSCRPLRLLFNGRLWLFVFLLVYCVLLSVVAFCALIIIAKENIPASMLAHIFLLLSMIFCGSIWMSSRWAFGREAVFLFCAFWLGKHPQLLIDLSLRDCACLLSLNWLMFGGWWFKWQPAKHHANLMFFKPTAAQQREIQQRVPLVLVSGSAKTWLGSRLLGAPDGWLRRAKEVLLLPLLLSVSLLPLSLLFPQFSWLFNVGVSGVLLLLTSGMGLAVLINFYRFLPMVWLTGVGKREQLFSVLWACFWRELSVGIAVIFTLLMLSEIVFDTWSGVKHWLVLLALVLVHQCLVFFLMAWIYQKGKSIFKYFWVGLILAQAWFAGLWATELVVNLPFDWQGISAHWLWMPEVILLLLLFKSVRQGFVRINLGRAP